MKTRRNIEQTFLRLLKDHPFDKITVRMICEEALVNKGTFYRHYQDKYDLARRTVDDELQRLHTEILDNAPETVDGRYPEDSMSSLLAAIRGVVADLLVLERLDESDLGVDVRHGIRTVVADGLRTMRPSEFVRDNIETAAWIITELLMDYPVYCEQVPEPLDAHGFIHAINDISELQLRLMPDTSRAEMGCLSRYAS